MDEHRYRESRLCRLFGNPVVYQLVILLDAGGPLTPSKLAKSIGRQISTISIHLAKLRNADVVRYDTSGKETRYWLKHKAEMRGLLRNLERVVQVSANISKRRPPSAKSPSVRSCARLTFPIASRLVPIRSFQRFENSQNVQASAAIDRSILSLPH